MDSLIERIEAAKGPDRELDLLIMRWVENIGGPAESALRYTENMDAAMTLVPADCPEWHAGKHYKTGQGQAYIIAPVALPDPIYVLAATPALALCAASLKARTNNPDTQPTVTEEDKAMALEVCPILPTEKHDMVVGTARSSYRRGYARALSDARTQQTARPADGGREALEAAFREGHQRGRIDGTDRDETPDWQRSKTLAALTPPTDEPLQDGGLREATYASFTDGMQAAAEICATLAETTYDDSDGFAAATGCEAAIMRVVREQRAEQNKIGDAK